MLVEECFIRLGEMYFMKYGQNSNQRFHELTEAIEEEGLRIKFLEYKLEEFDKQNEKRSMEQSKSEDESGE